MTEGNGASAFVKGQMRSYNVILGEVGLSANSVLRHTCTESGKATSNHFVIFSSERKTQK